jgi:hypothetical protein
MPNLAKFGSSLTDGLRYSPLHFLSDKVIVTESAPEIAGTSGADSVVCSSERKQGAGSAGNRSPRADLLPICPVPARADKVRASRCELGHESLRHQTDDAWRSLFRSRALRWVVCAPGLSKFGKHCAETPRIRRHSCPGRLREQRRIGLAIASAILANFNSSQFSLSGTKLPKIAEAAHVDWFCARNPN